MKHSQVIALDELREFECKSTSFASVVVDPGDAKHISCNPKHRSYRKKSLKIQQGQQ